MEANSTALLNTCISTDDRLPAPHYLHSILYAIGMVPTSLTCHSKITQSHIPFLKSLRPYSRCPFWGLLREVRDQAPRPITWKAKANFQIESTPRTAANHIPRRHCPRHASEKSGWILWMNFEDDFRGWTTQRVLPPFLV